MAEREERMNRRPSEVVRPLPGFPGWQHQPEPKQVKGKANLDKSEFGYVCVSFLPHI